MKELEYYLAIASTLTVVPVVIGTIIPMFANIFAYSQVKSDLEKKEETPGQGPKIAFDSAKEIIKEYHGFQSILHLGEILAAKSYMRNYKSLYSEPRF